MVNQLIICGINATTIGECFCIKSEKFDKKPLLILELFLVTISTVSTRSFSFFCSSIGTVVDIKERISSKV